MSHNKLVFISGSPSKTSRSFRVLEAVADRLQAPTLETRLYSPQSFEPESLLFADTTHHAIQAFIDEVKTSSGLVVATPVYKGTFTGALKLILDLIPPDALIGKVGLAIATARLPGHLAGAATGLANIFDFFKLGSQVAPLLLPDDQIFDAPQAVNPGFSSVEPSTANATARLVEDLSEATHRAVRGRADQLRAALSSRE